MYNLVALVVFAVVLAALYLLRKRLGLFWSATGFFVATVLYVMLGFDPPTPGSLVVMYLATSGVAWLLYVTSSDEARDSFWRPIRSLIVEPDKRPYLYVLMGLIPLLVAWQTWQAALPSEYPPARTRSVHPAPPPTVQVNTPHRDAAYEFDVLYGHNPLREQGDEAMAEAVERGRVVYFENCYYCHGDTLSGDGHYAALVSPPPADFTDVGILPMFSEGYFFWRVAKGGPGLPAEGTPWDSTMPVWQDMLSVEDMWSVMVFLYDYTGREPREVARHGAAAQAADDEGEAGSHEGEQ